MLFYSLERMYHHRPTVKKNYEDNAKNVSGKFLRGNS